MHKGIYVFAQPLDLIDKDVFLRLANTYDGNRYVKQFTHLPSGVKNDFLLRGILKLFGFTSIKSNDIAISRNGRSYFILPSSLVLKVYIKNQTQ